MQQRRISSRWTNVMVFLITICGAYVLGALWLFRQAREVTLWEVWAASVVVTIVLAVILLACSLSHVFVDEERRRLQVVRWGRVTEIPFDDVVSVGPGPFWGDVQVSVRHRIPGGRFRTFLFLSRRGSPFGAIKAADELQRLLGKAS